MNPKLESLKSETERLPDGPDKSALLKMLAQIAAEDKEIKACTALDRSQKRRDRIVSVLLGLLIVGPLAYLSISGALTGKILNVFVEDAFVKNIEYVYWDRDPYLYSFLIAFYSLIAFAFFCAAVGVTHFGRNKPTMPRTREEFERFLKEEAASLEEYKRQFPEPTFFRFTYRSMNVPAWLVMLTVALLVGTIIYGATRSS